MGPRYRLILPEYPPDRDYWVMPDQIVRNDKGVPHPFIDTRMMATMLGLTKAETEFIVHHELKNFPEVSRKQGTRRVIDLHTMELILERLFKVKTRFRFDRLYLGQVHIKNLAYLYGYIDRNGYRLYPNQDTQKEYEYQTPMKRKKKRALRKKDGR